MIRAFFLLSFLNFAACSNGPATNAAPQQASTEASSSFFPVTVYLKGQIADIKSSGINPLKIDSVKGRIDSVWLKVEELGHVFQDFLEPEIDSNNLAQFYKEDRFADETLYTYTLTYTALPNLPKNNPLQRWDVYINPESNTIKSIYLVKQFDNRELQLTWQSNKSCKKVSIATDKTGRQFVEYEQVIKWNFD